MILLNKSTYSSKKKKNPIITNNTILLSVCVRPAACIIHDAAGVCVTHIYYTYTDHTKKHIGTDHGICSLHFFLQTVL